MSTHREDARRLVGLSPADAEARLKALGAFDAEGLEALLDEARSLMRDDPSVGSELAALVNTLALSAHAPVLQPRAAYLMAQGSASSGDMITALTLIDAARSEFERLGHHEEALRTNLGRSQALNEMGRHAEALAACRTVIDALSPLDADDHESIVLVAAAHQNSGLCLEMSGQFEAALDHYAAAKLGYEAIGDRRAVAEVTYDRALVLLHLGQHGEALDALQRAEVAFRQGGFRALQVMALANTAEVRLHRGEYQQCLEALGEAASALEGISWPGGEQARLLVAGRAYLALNLLPEALASFKAASDLLEKGDLIIDWARAQWGLGVATARSGRPKDALEAMQAATRQFRASGQSEWLAQALLDEARLLHQMGRPIDARDVAGAAVATAIPGTPASITASLLLAEMSDAPAEELAAIVDAADELGLMPLMASASQQFGRALLRADEPGAAVGPLQRAVDIIEGLRGGIASDVLLTRFLDDKRTPYHDLLSGLLAADAPPRASLRVAEQAKSRTLSDIVAGLVHRSRDVDTADVADLHAAYAELFSGATAGDDERTERLRARVRDLESQRGLRHLESGGILVGAPPRRERTVSDDVVISYAVAGGAIHAFVVAHDDVVVTTLSTTVGAVQQLVHRLRRHWDRFRLGSDVVQRHLPQLEASTRAVLSELHEALWHPVEASLPVGTDRVVIVPDDVLHDVPFHTLCDGEGWLCERFAVSYAPSIGTLRHLEPRAIGAAIVAGAADELAPRVDEEVMLVGSLLEGATVRVGADATWASIVPELSGLAHLHLAGHAMYRPDNPMYSALRFPDRWVTAADVLGLDLRGATVVLSACDTARTQFESTAEINGFVRGFLGAGASTVIASQWTADDAATTELMAEFYSRLATQPPATALRDAQLSISSTWRHPYYWAAWTVVGRG